MTLSERILEEITNRPGQSAADIAKTLGVSRIDVTTVIYDDLYGALEHDSEFYWRLKEKVEPTPSQQKPAVGQREQRRCERCSQPIGSKGSRFCFDCASEVWVMMEESGYLEPRPFRRKPRSYEAMENTSETKGGSGEREAWQMTLGEWKEVCERLHKLWDAEHAPVIWQQIVRLRGANVRLGSVAHRIAVKEALCQGKPVSQAILRDYPGLLPTVRTVTPAILTSPTVIPADETTTARPRPTVRCKNCGDRTNFNNAEPERERLGWCLACYRQSLRQPERRRSDDASDDGHNIQTSLATPSRPCYPSGKDATDAKENEVRVCASCGKTYSVTAETECFLMTCPACRRVPIFDRYDGPNGEYEEYEGRNAWDDTVRGLEGE